MEKHVRELWDYLKDYGASNIHIEPGAKHQKLCFEYGGIDRSYILAHKQSTDYHAMSNTKAALRRMLGPPVPVVEKQPRKLEEMMEELNTTTALRYDNVRVPEPKPSKTWQVWMCGYAAPASTQVYIYFPPEIKQVFPGDVQIERLDDEHWKVSPGAQHRLYDKGRRVSVSYNDKQIKPFGSTKAEAVEADGAILVYLPVEKRAAVAPLKGVKPWPTQLAASQPPVTMPLSGYVNHPPQPAAPAPVSDVAALTRKPPASTPVLADLETQMRDVIRQIQAIEATCPYHLVRLEGGRIQWRAPVIE